MTLHVIVGSGPVGLATAIRLAEQGHRVRVLTRSGGGPAHEGVERIAADATDTDRLAELVTGAEALYACASPPYQRWATEWPPLAASMLYAAEVTGAVLVTMSNLYGYGPVDHPMSEGNPLRATGPKGKVRAAMWAEALAAHQAGRARVTEARASDYFGPGVRHQSHIGERSIPRVLKGRPVRVLGDPDVPHSWTYVPDIASARSLLPLPASPRLPRPGSGPCGLAAGSGANGGPVRAGDGRGPLPVRPAVRDGLLGVPGHVRGQTDPDG